MIRYELPGEDKVLENAEPLKVTKLEHILRSLSLLMVFLVFLGSLELIGKASAQLGTGLASKLIPLTSAPIVSLFIGILLTAIVQSSSTITSGMVALVGTGAMSLQDAVPLVIGANIGTTVTATLVAFGNVTRKKEFRKGFMTAILHAAFNILSAIIFFFLEWKYQFLSKISAFTAHHLAISFAKGSHLGDLFQFLSKPFSMLFANLVLSQPWIILMVSVFMLFVTISLFTAILKGWIFDNSWQQLSKVVVGSPFRAILSGIGLTTAIHSSGVVTSLCVMASASEKLLIRNVYSIILGANIGTTITALIASLSRNETAIALALTHFFFNLFGVIIFNPYFFMKEIPFFISRILGKLTIENRAYAFVWILTIYFILPFLMIFIYQV